MAQPDGKILIGGLFTQVNGQPRRSLARLNADGSLDSAFNSGWSNASIINSIALQADGGVLVNGSLTWSWGRGYSLPARLNADGSRDASFAPNPQAGYTITLQADGRVLISTSSSIRRLYNTGTARQSLLLNGAGTSITWVRSGPGPQVGRVTFEVSADGQSYTPLGSGTYADGAWHLDGVTMPAGQGLFIRARGFYSGGLRNGSGSIVEMVKRVYLAGRGLPGAILEAPASAAEGSPFSLALRNRADPTNPYRLSEFRC